MAIKSKLFIYIIAISLVIQSVKNLAAMQETWVGPLGREDPLEKEMATHSCGHRSLAGYSPWGCKEMDMTGQLTHIHTILKKNIASKYE